jgi:hypothetical protein
MKYLILLLLLIPNTYAFLEITEVMYRPSESYHYNEWIEIYNDGTESINITKLILCSEIILPGFINHSNNEAYLENNIEIGSNQYAIITDGGSGTEAYNNYNINPNSTAIHVDAASLCSGLSDGGELIDIYFNNELADALNYHPNWGGNGEGKSLCKLNNIWQNCEPTPGYANENIQSDAYTIKITEFLPDPEGYDSAPMPYGEWIELFNYGEIDLDLTGIILKDKANHKLIISDTTTYTQIIKSNEYLVVYTNNKSGFLNNDGLEEIRLLTPEEIQIEKITYSDSREGNSWSKINETWHLTIPTKGETNPENPENNKASIIEIENIYLGNDNVAKFGDNLRIRLNIYKGDETKESIKAYIERNNKKISKTTSFNIIKKFSENIITIPIQIFPNCNLKYEEGEYEVVIEGLNEKTIETIKIEGITQNLCEKQICTEENLVNYMEKINFETVINQDSQPNEIIYESKGKKTSKSGIYFFTLILVLLTIQIITEKWKK